VPLAIEEPPEPVLPALAPEFIEPDMDPEPVAPALPAVVAALLPPVEPCAVAPRLPPVPPPPGVPVVPIGVFCVLRWPAPTAALEAGRGGVPWAKATLTVAAATTAAARILIVDILQDSFGWT
jgi:hypothetical protein